MLGLGAYDSSSEEETEPRRSKPVQNAPIVAEDSVPNECSVELAKNQSQLPVNVTLHEVTGPVLGPSSGPAPIDSAQATEGPSADGHTSPFSISRALVQDLTLPPVPNLDIPPSPPGSPDPAANAKFEHFLSLKNQGVHFNSKLASSSSLRNPSLLMKMMEHAGIDEQAQYHASLPSELWDITSLPRWGFKDELLKTQQETRWKMEEKKATGQRSSIDFVSGSGTKGKVNP